MSKTVDDLIAIYDAARKGAPIMGDMRRAGIAAVVSELMEHFVTGASTYAWDADDLHAEFMKILGDAGEKVAEYTGGMNDLSVTPATAPAPAVCVWKQQSLQAFYNSACGLDSMTHGNAVCKCQDTCPSCGKPIAFKGA